jgi:pimeloyl-ACP methyl ester carboxylesterase
LVVTHSGEEAAVPRFLIASLIAVALMVIGAPTAIAGPPVPRLDWEPCDPGFQCATARVPRDYARPHGPKVELALIRRPATDREHRIGSLFFNPGGPGGSGVDFVRFAPPPALEAFGRLYDIVGFDPRGVGGSSPPVRDCGVPRDDTRFVRPETADRDALLGRADEQIERCQRGSGGILPYLTTGNVARDLDLLRAAVGDRKLNFVGLSYGGQIAETYTTLFPGRTGALVIDSPVDGDVWLNHPFEAQVEQNVSFENSFRRFLQWCSRREEICALDPEDPEDDYDALVERLNATPVPVLSDPSQAPVNGDELLALTDSAMSSKFSWAPLAAVLTQVKTGDGSLARELLEPPSDGSGSTGVLFAYLANEVRYPSRPARYMRAMEHNFAITDHFFFARGYEWIGVTRWPFDPNGVFRGPFRHAASAQTPLVIGGTHDPNAPYKWAKRYVADLGNARLLTYRSDGHVALTDLNACVGGWFLAYIEHATLPPPGASCKQAVPSASVAGAARSGASRTDLERWKRTTETR